MRNSEKEEEINVGLLNRLVELFMLKPEKTLRPRAKFFEEDKFSEFDRRLREVDDASQRKLRQRKDFFAADFDRRLAEAGLESLKPKHSKIDSESSKPESDVKAENEKTAKQKGDEFENFVISKFDRRYFRLIDWRSDKGFEGIYPESNKDPDLLLEYKPESARFAVECKWRQRWWDINYRSYINWTGGDDDKGERKIETYLQYSQEKGVPVFVVIGVGGKPSAPEELFVAPLDSLKLPKAEKTNLGRFRKRNFKESNFYFDCKNCSLK